MSFVSKMSIRQKLGLLLAIGTASILSAYAYLVLTNVAKDKIAYVYDSNLALSESLAQATSRDLELTLHRLEFYISQYSEVDGFSALAKSSIADDSLVQAVYIRAVTSGQESSLAGLNDFQTVSPDIRAQLGAPKEGTKATLFASQDHIGSWYLTTLHKASSESYLITLRFNPASFYLPLQKSQTQDSYLINESGTPLAGPRQPLYPIAPSELKKISLANANHQNVGQFVNEHVAQNGQIYLAAATPVSFPGLQLVSLIPKAVALEALYLIFAKSILFLGLLLSLAFVISMIAPARLTRNLRRLSAATQSVETGHFEIEVPITSQDEIGSLSVRFNQMVKKIKQLMLETAEKARMANELKTAQMVQTTLLPNEDLQTNRFSLQGHYEPASECGGDWWFYKQHGPKTFFWIGDVTGHGAASAMVTSAACSVANVCMQDPTIQPHQILSLMNKAIHATTKGKLMMTLFVGCLDESSGLLQYSVASHEPPFLLPGGVNLDLQQLQALDKNNGPRLGDEWDSEYGLSEIQLSPGDRIFLYTDGVVDLANKKGRPFGETSLARALVRSGNNTDKSQNLFSSLKETLAKHREGAELVDDVTFLLLAMNS